MLDDQFSTVEKAIWQAHPHTLADAAVRALTGHPAVEAAEVLLADYRLSFLIPTTLGADPLRLDGTVAGRAFAAQQPVLDREGGHEAHGTVEGDRDGDGTTLYVPITVYGDRVGVLAVSLTRVPTADERLRLLAVATALARALKVADQNTDLYQRIRRRSRLTLPAEIQWSLLPALSCVADEYHLAGMLEPAYAIWGDNFDWSASQDDLIVSVTNGMGRGTEAALLTHLAISALRNARRSGGGIVDQAVLANESLHQRHQGRLHVSTLLMRFDLDTGRVAAVDAGSPLIFRMRGGGVARIELDAELPLGMFEDTRYSEQEFTVEPGDRLVIVSDGVHAALSPGGDAYGASGLPSALRQTRLQNPPEAVRTLTRNLIDYHNGTELQDDAVIVCLDWTGRPAEGTRGGEAPAVSSRPV
jgi:serine phosphatase RsbU (regulator of sigma subunit)